MTDCNRGTILGLPCVVTPTSQSFLQGWGKVIYPSKVLLLTSHLVLICCWIDWVSQNRKRSSLSDVCLPGQPWQNVEESSQKTRSGHVKKDLLTSKLWSFCGPISWRVSGALLALFHHESRSPLHLKVTTTPFPWALRLSGADSDLHQPPGSHPGHWLPVLPSICITIWVSLLPIN